MSRESSPAFRELSQLPVWSGGAAGTRGKLMLYGRKPIVVSDAKRREDEQRKAREAEHREYYDIWLAEAIRRMGERAENAQ